MKGKPSYLFTLSSNIFHQLVHKVAHNLFSGINSLKSLIIVPNQYCAHPNIPCKCR